MKKIPLKNYVILLFIILITVVITFVLANFYNNSLRKTTDIYKYANRLKRKEIEEYLDESSSVVIYIADKYDFSKETEEEILKKKIVELNLYNNFIYIDKREFNQKLVDLFNLKYKTKIDIEKIPMIILYSDDNTPKVYYSVDANILEKLDFGDIK